MEICLVRIHDSRLEYLEKIFFAKYFANIPNRNVSINQEKYGKLHLKDQMILPLECEITSGSWLFRLNWGDSIGLVI